ncbi:PREDICTED: uncharacterized protein LOC101383164 [Odobenus rosmarus divergens]|uniref:Uncharacterized protein LOC101383164 n=1 Tax=Odobenus rosmarus divergens TaxID=9708 RepID=A0A9B0HBM6_ODORO
MVVIFPATGSLPCGSRRRRLVLKPTQQGALHALFQQNPYPGIATRERLARELDIPESRIQVWFQNQRMRQIRQSRLASTKSQEQGPTHGQEQPPSWTQEHFTKDGRRKRISISPSQTSILLQAFEKNHFPSIATREHLANFTGLPESRIQVHFQSVAHELFSVEEIVVPETLLWNHELLGVIHRIQCPGNGGKVLNLQVWFQNRRARHPGQNRSGPVKDMEVHPKPNPHVTVPVEPGLLASVPISSPRLALSNPLGSMQGLPAGTTPIPCMGFAPPVFCEHQQHHEHAGMAPLPFQDYPQPLPDYPCQWWPVPSISVSFQGPGMCATRSHHSEKSPAREGVHVEAGRNPPASRLLLMALEAMAPGALICKDILTQLCLPWDPSK